ncbi:MAG: T9SS type A sorting domain-containing protein [Bacteroidota bacterium]
MRIFLLLLACTFCIHSLSAQLLQATANEDHELSIDTVAAKYTQIESRSNFDQLAGFPKGFVANPTFKNFRNVALADLNGDGSDEIIVGINNRLYAYSADTLLWERILEGVAIYPPAVADIDGDGDLEIAQHTGGINVPGGLYVVAHDGTDHHPNFPLSFNDHWMIASPVLYDVDGNGQLEIIAAEREDKKVHLLAQDGTPFGKNWPQTLLNTPAVTPSVGDVDGDGEVEIVIFSTREQYVFNLDGSVLPDYPVAVEGLRYSYQSPILRDIDGDAQLDIIAAGHGDAPEFFVRNSQGTYLEGWAQAVPFDSWTYSTPALLDTESGQHIIMGRRGGVDASEVVFKWNAQAELLDEFPIVKSGGAEGLITIADVDGDGAPELVFDSNLFDADSGKGFIHAYEMDGSAEVIGFPIRPKGWTYMNGATLGDVDGDGQMDAVALTYTQNFGTATDSILLNVYKLGVPYAADRVWWSTYKGSNDRAGDRRRMLSAVNGNVQLVTPLLFPNPARSSFFITGAGKINRVAIYHISGQLIHTFEPISDQYDISQLPSGLYIVEIWIGEKDRIVSKLMIEK